MLLHVNANHVHVTLCCCITRSSTLTARITIWSRKAVYFVIFQVRSTRSRIQIDSCIPTLSFETLLYRPLKIQNAAPARSLMKFPLPALFYCTHSNFHRQKSKILHPVKPIADNLLWTLRKAALKSSRYIVQRCLVKIFSVALSYKITIHLLFLDVLLSLTKKSDWPPKTSKTIHRWSNVNGKIVSAVQISSKGNRKLTQSFTKTINLYSVCYCVLLQGSSIFLCYLDNLDSFSFLWLQFYNFSFIP